MPVLVLTVGCAAAVAVIVYLDSTGRGRYGGRWVLACILIPPLAVPAFLVVAVTDRLRGRRGIETVWAPEQRWWLMAGVVLTIAAAALAVSSVQVRGASVDGQGVSGSFSGACGSALSVVTGTGAYGAATLGPQPPPALVAAQATVSQRCSAAAGRRVGGSALCLGGAFCLALIGASVASRRRDHDVPASDVWQ